MKIKIKITLLFTLLVTLIILVLGVSVYYFFSLNRKNEFTERLKNRALTTTRLLLEVEEINKPLLRKIDSFTMNLLFEEKIAIYNHKNELLYSNLSEQPDSLNPDTSLLNKIRLHGQFRFSAGEYESIGVVYKGQLNHYVVLATAIDRIGRNQLSQLKRILLLSGLVGILITMLAGYFFSINILRPLTRINRDMNEISFQNISRRIITDNKKDEMSELVNTFNNLLDRLEASFNNQKRFIANASHELSTPLTAISSQLEVALMQNRSDKEYKDVLASVQEDVIQLNKLVRKLLELAKAETGKGISLEPVRIDDILLRAAQDVNTLHKNYNVYFSFDEIPEEEALCYTYGNEELLFIAFKNIMENACKYSDAHKAWVSVAIDPAKKTIRIKDEGIGMTKEDLKKVFEPFFRSSKAEQFSDGMGLGLSMSSRIIHLHKGEISIDSQPGKGSVFTITLPSA
ncbi:MAG: HAMP domain-containing histidine kinase [Chitinophagaceae bacterium]|nr:MAG: HAMP domain-containing histidine kinase [Chitinophagaceae bacterium]